MNKEEFLNYIIDFATDTEWGNLKQREQLRALFTAWCFIHGIDADTKECDDALETLYVAVDLPESQRYELEQYMIELIV